MDLLICDRFPNTNDTTTEQSGFTYADEVMFREAAGSDVVLEELLGEVLVHLGCFMGVHVVS